MGFVFYIMGKSASGKDTLYRRLLLSEEPKPATLIPYTTRPMRDGEENGREYIFTSQAGLEELRQAGRVIEERVYMTCYGPWYYFTADDGRADPDKEDLLLTGTLESFRAVQDYYGKERVVPLYIEVEDGERLQRALNRERAEKTPKYEEMCRRFLADAQDFGEDKIRAAGIVRRFYNDDPDRCLAQIKEYMAEVQKAGRG